MTNKDQDKRAKKPDPQSGTISGSGVSDRGEMAGVSRRVGGEESTGADAGGMRIDPDALRNRPPKKD